MVYYNEIDPFAAQWLRELINAGAIASGEVDERSIEDVTADDLAGFCQHHFFAGIGVWSYALRLAGWPDGRSRMDQLPRQAQLSGPARLTASGEILTGSTAGMGNGGQLNPAHARWLQGLPRIWDDCAVMAMRSMHNRQQHS